MYHLISAALSASSALASLKLLPLYIDLYQSLLAYIQVALHNFRGEELEAHGFADFDEAENDGLAHVGHCVVQLRREGICRELKQVP